MSSFYSDGVNSVQAMGMTSMHKQPLNSLNFLLIDGRIVFIHR